MRRYSYVALSGYFVCAVIALIFFFPGKKNISVYAHEQWSRPSAVHKIEATPGAEPEFVIVFIHGFLGFGSFGEFDSWNEFVHKVVPALHGRNYVVYHPGLVQTRDVQSFAQDADTQQVMFHLKKIIQEIEKEPEESSLGGHSISGLPLLCVGHSNGASTLMSLVAQHHDIAKEIDGLMLLSPFADLRQASTLARVSRVSPTVAGIGAKLFFAPRYSPSKKSPEKYVKEGLFPDFLPTLLVNTRNDFVVPFKNRDLLALAFDMHRKYEQNVGFLDLDTGGHNWGWRRVKLSCEHCERKTNHTHLTHEQKIAAKIRKYRYYLRSDDREALQRAITDFIDQKVM